MYHDEIHSRDRENNLNIQKLVGGKKPLEVCLKGIRVNEHFNINIGSLKKVGENLSMRAMEAKNLYLQKASFTNLY